MELYDNDFCCMELYDKHFRCMEVNPGRYFSYFSSIKLYDSNWCFFIFKVFSEFIENVMHPFITLQRWSYSISVSKPLGKN